MKSYQRIVLIDDNEDDNFFHEIMIRKAGFDGDVQVFDNGFDALAFLENDGLALKTCIFLDINMPMLDGFEVASQAEPMLKDKDSTMLVMLTSSGSPVDRERALSMDVINGYVTKPLTVDSLKDLLGGLR
ncbi:response regulator [Hydrogenophaga sp. A37]|uniref:response regulator n=1 Tax=Hydrogenophaga sp. A37 TaxID=1945864 RepID=UPI0009855B69|nr:response regulator [Hydrogenophaga sp. A37]OOG85456.1 hypothetical protein B0E41_07900 [Hydrogenophaga sp. A37]